MSESVYRRERSRHIPPYAAPREETAARPAQSPYGGTPLQVSGALASRIKRGFGLRAGELALRESPDVAAMGARATAQGNAIRFAPGEFSPETPEGLAVLGHELNHVRQQAMGNVSAPGGEVFDSPAHEAASERAGEAFAEGALQAASQVSASGVNAGSAPVQMSPLSWLRHQRRNYNMAKAEGKEQQGALDMQAQINENVKQGDYLTLRDQLANAQYKAGAYSGMRSRRADLQYNRVMAKSEAQQGRGGYEQGRGGIGRWLGKKLFHKAGGEQAMRDVGGEIRSGTDYNAQAEGLQSQINARNAPEVQAATFRDTSGAVQNQERNRVYEEQGWEKPTDVMVWSRTSSLMKHGGTQEDRAFNDEAAKSLHSLYTHTEGNAENYPKLCALVQGACQRLLDFDIDAVARMPDDEILARMDEISDIERPLMFVSDLMRNTIKNDATGQQMVDELYSPAQAAEIRRRTQLIGYVQRVTEAKAILAQPQLHEQMGIAEDDVRRLQNTIAIQGNAWKSLIA